MAKVPQICSAERLMLQRNLTLTLKEVERNEIPKGVYPPPEGLWRDLGN